MARIRTSPASTGHTILVVDDDADLRVTLSHLLRKDGHEVFEASSGEAAINLCREHPFHLMLLDYFMPGLTGKDVVEQVRALDLQVQIILQTGYATEKPPRQMLAELDIQGYHDKSEGPERLLVWADAALKTYRHVRALHSSRRGLEYILKATPELHRLQPLDDLLQGILMQVQGLLGFSSACLATISPDQRPPEGDTLLALAEQQQFVVRVGTGRFEHCHWESLAAADQTLLLSAAESGETKLGQQSVLPLKVGTSVVGMVLFDHPLRMGADLHLLEIFASQAAVAIENVRLYSLATVDDLTGLLLKRPWLRRLTEVLSLAGRAHTPTSVLALDIDHFKRINDTHGHLAGDRLLSRLGELLRAEVRLSDVPGRYGGEELVVLLPNTDEAGAQVLAARVLASVAALRVSWGREWMGVTVSIGIATTPGKAITNEASDMDLLARADEALYRAKRAGRNRIETAISLAQPETV